MCGGVHDVITGNKFHQNQLRGFRATWVGKSGSCIDLACRCADCDAVFDVCGSVLFYVVCDCEACPSNCYNCTYDSTLLRTVCDDGKCKPDYAKAQDGSCGGDAQPHV